MSLFITLEGIEGSGKSTLSALLVSALKSQGRSVLATREPGGTDVGKILRKLILEEELDPVAEALLFAADRAEHVKKVIQPCLNSGSICICDRYVHSTLSYQGAGRGMDESLLANLSAIATGGLMPDIVFLLDLEPEEGLRRARTRATQSCCKPDQTWTRFESKEIEFHRRIRERYLEMSRQEKNFIVLDATKSPDEVASAALAHLNKR